MSMETKRSTPLDVLIVINTIAAAGEAENLSGLGIFPDVSADNQVTPIDALMVINELARLGSGLGEGEFIVEKPAADADSTDAVFSGWSLNDLDDEDDGEGLEQALDLF